MADAEQPGGPRGGSGRLAALLIALVSPWGLGHLYLGRTRRALVWFVASQLASLLFLVVVAVWADRFGLLHTALIALLFGASLWVASLVDLYRLPNAQLRRAPWLVMAFWVAGVLANLALSTYTKTSVAEAFKIPSSGMRPTLAPNDHIWVDKRAFRTREPKRGELVTFRMPGEPTFLRIERVIALAGETLTVRDGHPFINDWEVPHCSLGHVAYPDAHGESESGELELEYLDGASYLVFFDDARPYGVQGPYFVNANEVWVLGDNRNNSADSRFFLDGRGSGVPIDDITGRALLVWMSFTPGGQVDFPRIDTRLDEPRLYGPALGLQPALTKCMTDRPPHEHTVPPGSR